MATKDNCLFCKIVANEIPSKIVLETEHVVAFEDINPQAPCHVLIIPKEHIASTNEVDDRHAETLGRLFAAARRVAEQCGVRESGYRMVMNTGANAGQTVCHVHLHVLGGRDFRWPPG